MIVLYCLLWDSHDFKILLIKWENKANKLGFEINSKMISLHYF